MPRKIAFVLVLSMILSACLPPSGGAPVTATQTSEVSKTSEVIPAITTPEATETSTSSSTPIAENVGDGATLLTVEQAAGMGLTGEGIVVKSEYDGVPVEIVSLVSSEAAKQIGVDHFELNPKHAEFGDPADERLSQLVLMGHYRGFLEDHGMTYETYTFERYMTDLKAGKDMRYYIWDGDVEGVVGGARVKIDPRARTEVVLSGGVLDPNGPSNTYITDAFRYGYGVNEDGGVRITLVVPLSVRDSVAFLNSTEFVNALWGLGWSEKAQQYGPREVGKTSIPENEHWLDMMGLIEFADVDERGVPLGLDDGLFVLPE